MNVYDGARMSELLEAEGLSAADSAEDADLVVLNTCHIREKAAEKVYSDIGRIVKRGGGSPPMIAVAGCVAQAEGAEIPRRAPAVDIVVGPQAYHRLPEMVARAHAAGLTVTSWTFRADEKTTYPNVRDEMTHFLYTLGIDALFTNHPDQFPRR